MAKGQTKLPKRQIKFKNAFGVNAFEWDFLDGKNSLAINEVQLNAMKSFNAIRHYMDWEKLEQEEGRYSFNPTKSGGWNYDELYRRCKLDGIEVLACLKTIPKWLQATYPEDMRDADNVPLRFGKDFSDPRSYIEQAKVAFQYAARYGRNKKISRELLSVDERPRWNNDVQNTVKVGLNLIQYIECDNERDKWWKGPKAYQSGRQYAANLSAFYDGHKNTMGAGVGVKNADPTITVVMGGLAKPDVGYVREMIAWCRENRGLKKDGSVNLCWDIINFHYYTGDDSSPTGGEAGRGKAPELSNAGKVATSFVSFARSEANGIPVWLTETGYDVNQGSPLKAIPIGEKSALTTQADWLLRTALLNIRLGVERVFFYQSYDYNASLEGKFSSSGLINTDHSRKPATDFFVQASNLIGEYYYVKTLNSSPLVDLYKIDKNVAYVLVKPGEDGGSINYNLELIGVKSVKVCRPSAGLSKMTEEVVDVKNGKLNIFVTETPTFVLPIK